MHRLLSVALIAFLAISCSTSDSPVGVNRPGGEGPEGGSTQSHGGFTRVDLGTLGGSSSYASGVNNSGVVVGWSETASGVSHAFRWTAANGMVDLGALPGDEWSHAIAIIDTKSSADPEILGVSGDGRNWVPVTWSAAGAITRLPIPSNPGLTSRIATAFNSSGEVVGWDFGGALQHGWIWSPTDGTYDLSANLHISAAEGTVSAITSLGRVLLTVGTFGCVSNPECWRTYIWTRSLGYSLLPTADREASVTGLALNENGVVVGWIAGPGAAPSAYQWASTTGFKALRHYAGTGAYGYATSVNSSGTVVGADFDATAGAIVASIWSSAGNIARLSADDPNPSVAVAINDLGTVAGWATRSASSNHAVIWKRSSLAATSSLAKPVSTRTWIKTPNADCLSSISTISSRSALFDCVSSTKRSR